MRIKKKGTSGTILSPFDLFNRNEINLTTALCYLISKNKIAFKNFIKMLDQNLNLKFEETAIFNEKSGKSGRTDIEIKSQDTHIIIECKVGTNKLGNQLIKYINEFEGKNRYMCFITQERETNIIRDNEIQYKFISWLDIIEVFNKKKLRKKKDIDEFVKYVNRSYKMKNMNEVLIQDLSRPSEIDRYLEYYVYKRDVTFGNPLYFAPYFTRKSKKNFEGIKFISKVLGVLTIKSADINYFKKDLLSFKEDKNLIKKWIQGVQHKQKDKEKKYTFYFLDEPYEFRNTLKKDKGSGKGWISRRIPKNRNVDFITFIKHIPEMMNKK